MNEIVDVSEANAILSLYGLQIKYDYRDWYVAQVGAKYQSQHFSMWTRMYVVGGVDEAVSEILRNLEDVYVYVGIKQLP